MPQETRDKQLAKSLDDIRQATAEGLIKWKRLLHPMTGELLAFKSLGTSEGEGVASWTYMVDDAMLNNDDPDIEDGPSIARYPDEHPLSPFDAMVLAKWSDFPTQEALAKLIRLVRKVAE